MARAHYYIGEVVSFEGHPLQTSQKNDDRFRETIVPEISIHTGTHFDTMSHLTGTPSLGEYSPTYFGKIRALLFLVPNLHPEALEEIVEESSVANTLSAKWRSSLALFVTGNYRNAKQQEYAGGPNLPIEWIKILAEFENMIYVGLDNYHSAENTEKILSSYNLRPLNCINPAPLFQVYSRELGKGISQNARKYRVFEADTVMQPIDQVLDGARVTIDMSRPRHIASFPIKKL